MASTWGTNTWGSNEWQDDVITAVVSGQAATTSIGSPTVFNGQIIQPTESQLTASLGSISINSEVSLTGFGLTSSLGTTESFNETGWGRLTWNTADWGEGADETVSVSGLEATASPGSITTGIGVLLEMVGANHSMTANVGSPNIDAELGVAVTGVQSDFATPTLSYAGTLVGWGREGWSDLSWGESPNQVIALVGVDSTTSVGSISPADVVGLSGQEATTNVGSTTIKLDSTPAITGQQSTISQGTLGLEFGPASISGVSATFNVGTLGLEFGPADITGVSATASVGVLDLTPATLVDLTGIAATSAVGSISPADVVGLTGVSATSAVGSISPADVVGLSLDAINALQGEGGVQAYANINTGSNSSFSNIDTGSNTSYSDTSTGSNSSYSDQSTGSNSSYSNVASGSNTSYTDAA